MRVIAQIRADDEAEGEIIDIGVVEYTDLNGGYGYKIVLSNGDDPGISSSQALEDCVSNIFAAWAHWATYEEQEIPF